MLHKRPQNLPQSAGNRGCPSRTRGKGEDWGRGHGEALDLTARSSGPKTCAGMQKGPPKETPPGKQKTPATGWVASPQSHVFKS